jgi:hypothetical protein
MGRRSKYETLPEMLLEVLAWIFQIVPPWTSISVGAEIGRFEKINASFADLKFRDERCHRNQKVVRAAVSPQDDDAER